MYINTSVELGAPYGLGSAHPAEFLIGQGLAGDIQQRLLREVADEPRIGAMPEYRRRPGLLPAGDQLPQVHVTPVEGPVSATAPSCRSTSCAAASTACSRASAS